MIMNIQSTITNKQEVWIGVDLGTTGVRAIAYDVEGINTAPQRHFILFSPHILIGQRKIPCRFLNQ